MVALLAGGAGAVGFAQQVGRPVLDLPVGREMKLLSLWQRELAAAAESLAAGATLDVRVIGQADVVIAADSAGPRCVITPQQDRSEYRGTGGVLADVAADLPDDATILLSSSSTMLLKPLSSLIHRLAAADADVAMFVEEDQTVSNLMLVRAGCLRSIAGIGFVDFKEQALPRIARNGRVRAVRADRPVSVAARNRTEYLRGIRLLDRYVFNPREEPRPSFDPAFAETWVPTFSVVEAGANVSESARILDSVVLAGATVESGATIVRSIVCHNSVVPRGTTVVDQIVGGRNPGRSGR